MSIPIIREPKKPRAIVVEHRPGCRTERRVERDDLCNCGAAPRLSQRETRYSETYKCGVVVEEWILSE